MWEDKEWVTQLLETLPPAQREVMACVIDGLSIAEISELLGKTDATVRKNLQFVRERLRAHLRDEQHREQQTNPTLKARPTRKEAQ